MAVAFADLGDEIIVEEFVHIVIRPPAPLEARQRIIHGLRPGIHDAWRRGFGWKEICAPGKDWSALWRNSPAVRLKLAML